MTRCLFEAALSCWRQHIVCASAMGFGAQPFLFGKAKNRSSDETLIQLQGFQQADQATKPDASASRQNRIAKNGNNQRAGLHAALLPKIIKVFLYRRNHESSQNLQAKLCILAIPPYSEQMPEQK